MTSDVRLQYLKRNWRRLHELVKINSTIDILSNCITIECKLLVDTFDEKSLC